MNSHHLNGKGYFLDFIRDTGDTIGGLIVGYQLALQVPSIGLLIIGICLIVLSLILERWDRNAEWHSVLKDDMPEEGVDVIGYNEKWVDDDFNPKGIRMCILMDEGDLIMDPLPGEWLSAKWCPGRDNFVGSSTAPTHWRKI
jgi:hypothetical protein